MDMSRKKQKCEKANIVYLPEGQGKGTWLRQIMPESRFGRCGLQGEGWVTLLVNLFGRATNYIFFHCLLDTEISVQKLDCIQQRPDAKSLGQASVVCLVF